jgi:uncharacterized membrane protein YeaQ/YmgE (transglycosylase-associated protein family)
MTGVIILGILVFGLAIGWLAQLILGRDSSGIDWAMALVAGLAGSFLGGLVLSLISGDGLKLKASGFIGTIGGALIITAVWQYFRRKRLAEQRAAALKSKRSGRHQSPRSR